MPGRENNIASEGKGQGFVGASFTLSNIRKPSLSL